MTPIRTLGAWLRRLGSERVEAIALASLVLITAFLFALGPRLLARAADGAVRASVAAAPVANRDIAFTSVDRIEAGPASAPLAGVDAAGARLADALPASIRRLVVARDGFVDILRWRVLSGASAPTLASLRVQPGARDRIRFSSGRPPTGATGTVATASAGGGAGGSESGLGTGATATVPVFEVALSTDAARAIGAGVGSLLVLEPDPSEAVSGRYSRRIAIRIVGLYDALAPNDDYWYGDTDLVRSRLFALSTEIQFVDFAAFVDPAAYGPLLAATDPRDVLPVRYTWHLFVDPARLDSAGAQGVATDLRRAETVYPANSSGVARAALQTSLLTLLTDELARWQGARTVLAVVAVGPVLATIGAILLVSILVHRRRRAAQRLWLARGARRASLLAGFVSEALLVTLPPGVLGGSAAAVVVPSVDPGVTVALGAIVGLVAAALVAAPAIGELRAAGVGVVERDPGSAPSVARGRRRLVLEAFLVVLAVAAAVALRDRGARLPASGSTGSDALARLDPLGGIDPLVIGAPALAAAAAGLLAVRLVPFPLRALSIAAAARRDLVPMLGVARAVRDAAARAILLVVLLTAAMGAFAAAGLQHIGDAADQIAWQAVGARVRVAAAVGGALPSATEAAQWPGVTGAAGAYRGPATIAQVGGPVTVLAVDRAIEAVDAGTSAEAGLPAVMLGPAPTGDQPLPALISAAVARDNPGIRPGGSVAMGIGGLRLQVHVVGTPATFPGLAGQDRFVIVVREQLGLAPSRQLPTTDLFLDAPGGPADGLRAAAAAAAPGSTLTSQVDTADALRHEPSIAALSAGILVAVVVAAGYAALAIVVALALSGAARGTETAHLRALGTSRRQVLELVVVEHLPTVAVSVAAGVALGLGLFVALEPGLGLGDLLGSTADVPLRLEPAALALLVLGVALVAGLAIEIGALVADRVALSDAARIAAE